MDSSSFARHTTEGLVAGADNPYFPSVEEEHNERELVNQLRSIRSHTGGNILFARFSHCRRFHLAFKHLAFDADAEDQLAVLAGESPRRAV